jgi:hypothetical protein
VVFGNSLLEVNLMIEKLRLKPRLITHHSKTPLFVAFTIIDGLVKSPNLSP